MTGCGRTVGWLLLLAWLSLPVAAQDHWPNKRAFWTLTVVNAGIAVADLEYTQHLLHRYPWVFERNPLFGSRPSRPRMYTIVGAQQLGCAYFGHRLAKAHNPKLRRLWFVPQMVSIQGHGIGLTMNLSLRWKVKH
jgi:hypothetical protein